VTAPLTNVAIVNRALAKFGAGAVQTMADNTDRGRAVSLVYEETVLGLLSEYPWTFTKLTQQLQQVTIETADASGYLMEGWRYSFGMPANLLASPEKYLRDPRRQDWPVTSFEVQAGVIFCNEPTLYAVARFRPDESVWPPYFVTAVVACLAAELVMPISGNSGLLENLQLQAWGTPGEFRRGGKLGLAKLTDARNRGNSKLPPDPLTQARYGDCSDGGGSPSTGISGAFSSSVTAAQLQALLGTLPTTMPTTAGVLWNNGGVLCIS
jgi:hypothetical protein